MPVWLQHLLVLLIVAVCVAYVGWQMVRTFRLKKSKLGACCAKGCEASAPANPQAEGGTKPPPERIVFMPVEMLRKRS
jgi:hypothetical protein